MRFETLTIAIAAQLLKLFKLRRGMLLVAREFYLLSIFLSLVCLTACGRCPLEGVLRQVEFDACISNKGSYNGGKNPFAGYFNLDDASDHQKRVPVTHSEDVGGSSELLHLSSMFCGQNSEAKCSKMGMYDANRSGSGNASPEQSDRQHGDASRSSDWHMFYLSDGETITCSLNYKELGHEISHASVNKVDHIDLSFCGGHSPHQEEKSFFSKNLEIEKSQNSYSSLPNVKISPKKLDWGQKYLYHQSVAYLRLQNTCNESVLKIYEPFSTDRQFNLFNISKVVLGPGEVTTISFVFSPKWLGLSSAELILQTSFGGFLVEAQGLAVESPHRLRPLEGFGVSSGGWLSRKLPLMNPFSESIHLKQVTAWFAVYGSSNTFSAEAFCSRQNHQEANRHRFSNSRMLSSVNSNSQLMKIRPLSNWVIDPYKNESILEMVFSPDSEGKVLGTICMQLIRPLEGEEDTLVVPFEAEVNRTAAWKNTGLLSVFVEGVGCCDRSEATLSVLVRNSALHLIRIIGITEVFETKRHLQIKYSEGVLLFPGTVTHVALVIYDPEEYKSFFEMDKLDVSCILQILTNDTISPILEIPCWDMFSVQELLKHHLDNVDFSHKKTESSTYSSEKPFPMREKLGDAEVDEFVIKSWKSQQTLSGLYVLDEHELLFPTVPVGRYCSKSITVRNPSHKPIIVQLILSSRETMDNCRIHYDNLQAPLSDSYICDDSTGPSRFGFSLINGTVTEAYLHPYGSASLGPILFYPSNRCDWESLALIRNNLSGVELLSLHGSGGSHSLVLFEGLELVHSLNFNINTLFPPNMLPSDTSHNIKDVVSGCHKSLSKKLLAVNSGDFSVVVKRIHVSGTECGLDGFKVHDCKAFALEPGESIELGISYQPDFSTSLVYRDLELILAAGILVTPMKASLPLYVLNVCRNSIIWVRVKNCCLAVVIAAILVSIFGFLISQMAPSGSLSYSMKDERRLSCNHAGRQKDKSSSLNCNKGNAKPFASTKKDFLKSVQDEAPTVSMLTYSKCQHGDSNQERITDLSQPIMEGLTDEALFSDAPVLKETGSSACRFLKSLPVESAGNSEVVQPVSLTVRTQKDKRRRPRKRKGAGSGLTALVEVSSSQSGNSTPSSPLSPFTVSSEETCSPSLVNRQPYDSPSPFGLTGGSCNKGEKPESGPKVTDAGLERVGCARVSRKCDKLLSTQKIRPLLFPSATFPGMDTRSRPSRLAMSPEARAPGPRLQKAIEMEVQTSSDDTLTYDIWGNHFSGLHHITRSNHPSVMNSEAIEGNPDSLFLRGPRQTLLTNCRPRSVSSSYEQG